MVMGVLSLALTVFLLILKKQSVYGAICLWITVFVGLFLLDTAVVIRYFGIIRHGTGVDVGLNLPRFLFKTKEGRIEAFSNIAAFVPFGFFLSEFLSSKSQFGVWRRIGVVTLVAFGLSLCIECLQLFLDVGFFEVTDLVLNTVGAFIGASLALFVRKDIGIDKKQARRFVR